MSLFGGDFGISDFVFQRLNRFKEHLSRRTQRKLSYLIEKFVILFSIAGPIMTLPQLIKIYSEKSVEGLSALTWSAYFFIALFWLIYGVFIKNKPLVLANTLWILMHASIITGIYLFG